VKDPAGVGPRPLAIVARSFYRELHNAGCSPKDIVWLVTELLALLAAEMRRARGGGGE
jgi:hypothetical protein